MIPDSHEVPVYRCKSAYRCQQLIDAEIKGCLVREWIVGEVKYSIYPVVE